METSTSRTPTGAAAAPRRGPFRISRFFARSDQHPFDEIVWERRRA